MPASNVHVGPSDYVPWMTDRKWCYIRMEGTTFGDVPLNCELKLEVWDSPNSAGVVIDAIRCAKLALDRGLSGALVGPSSYFMKTPPKQFTDAEARALTEEFINGNGVAEAADGNGATPGSAPVSGAGDRVSRSRTLVSLRKCWRNSMSQPRKKSPGRFPRNMR